jgi:Domain of unknown function (DUF4136)
MYIYFHHSNQQFGENRMKNSMPTPLSHSHIAAPFVILLAALSMVFIAGCSNVKVFSNADPTASFQGYKTFALIDEPHKLPAQTRASIDIVEATIEQALEKEMEYRGYVINENEPDLLVKYSIELDTETQVSSQPVYRSRPALAIGGFWRPRYYVSRAPVYVGTRTRAVTQREGVLIINIIDRQSGKVIWHGWAEEPIQNKNELAAAVSDNVRDIMNAYPGKAR